MKVVGIIGVPASGKTTLMRAVIECLGPGQGFKFGLLHGTQYKACYLLGLYNVGLFAGTDRLSMAVQPDAIRFLRWLATQAPMATVLFEGDRLTRNQFLSVPDIDYRLFVLTVTGAELDRRHAARRDTQSYHFKRSRATLVASICERFRVARIPHELPIDTAPARDAILAAI
jgi:hypothetical protein